MLKTAIHAAREAGQLQRRHFGKPLKANEVTAHDIKLELDVRSQKLIEKIILRAHPSHAILGEEGVSGDANSEYRWIVDPLDGTVNFAYSIPHFCVSIACQKRTESFQSQVSSVQSPKSKLKTENLKHETSHLLTPGWQTIAGVIYDPVRDEMFSASQTQNARLNGKPIRVSPRTTLAEAIVSVGIFKTPEVIEKSLPHFKRLVHEARKVRIMGAAALDVAYVACGRYDVYLEYGVKLWDVAAGLLILEKAGGICELRPQSGYAYNVFAGGKIPRKKVVAEF